MQIEINNNIARKEWWKKRRLKYNIGLIISGILAFITYAIVGLYLIVPDVLDFKLHLFILLFKSFDYLFIIIIANLFYNLGHYTDKRYNKENSETFRKRLFNLGFWFSFSVPFSIPISVIVRYLMNHT